MRGLARQVFDAQPHANETIMNVAIAKGIFFIG